MKSRIIAGTVGIAIAAAGFGIIGTGVAAASPLQVSGGAPEMAVCTDWLIEHAVPCIPGPPPFRRHGAERAAEHAEHAAGHHHGR